MAEPNPSQHVARGGKLGGLTGNYDYDAADGGPVAGWSKVDDMAGASGDHFAQAEHTGNAGHPQPGEQA